MEKIDFKTRLASLYRQRAGEISVVDVPPLAFLMIDGAGDPNGSATYRAAVESLFAVSYTLKFMVKKSDRATDYGVMPLEGLWWADDHRVFETADRGGWRWTMMIMQPDFVSAEQVQRAIETAGRKKNLPALSQLRFETFCEGRSAQLLHVGPFSDEGPNIQRLHRFVLERGTLSGRHHEIYLSDTVKAAPRNWKTILRQPFHDKENCSWSPNPCLNPSGAMAA